MSLQNTKATTCIILAAGYGSRLAGLTQQPKCLIQVGGSTLLERHFSAWKAQGLKNVVLVLGFEAEQIIEVCRKYENDFYFQFAFNHDYRNLGNTYSLFLGLQLCPNDCLIFDADLVYEDKILSDFLNDSTPDQILVGPASIEDVECSKALVDQQNLVRMTVDKRALTEQELERFRFVGEAMGILKFSALTTKQLRAHAEQFISIEKNKILNWEHLLNQFLPTASVGVHLAEASQWVEIDTPEDYQRATALFPQVSPPQ